MDGLITHIEDGETKWIISKDGRRFLIEFCISENTLTEESIVMFPVDVAHFEPSVVELTVDIEKSMLDFGKEDEEDWIEVNLLDEDEKAIKNYIEITYEL